MDQRASELRWPLCALGLLAHFGFDRCRFQRLKFGFDSGDVRIDQVVEQAGSIRAQLVDRFVMSDLLVHPLDTLDQLRRQGAPFAISNSDQELTNETQ